MFLKSIRKFLTDNRVAEMNRDGEQRVLIHAQILNEKKMMKSVFEDFYRVCLRLNQEYFSGEGDIVELGGAGSTLKNYEPRAKITDVVPGPGIDIVVDAQKMNLTNSSVRAFFGINCFHHFCDPDQFFSELLRVLRPGGGCVLIDPYYGPVSSVFHTNLHDTEFFDKTVKDWRAAGPIGALTNANQALSYVVFMRDRAKFESNYPSLKIVYHSAVNNSLRYLLSGGLNFRQLVPDFMIEPVRWVEMVLTPVERLFALHHVIVLKRVV
jgi:SAM-dependent methyltransferase